MKAIRPCITLCFSIFVAVFSATTSHGFPGLNIPLSIYGSDSRHRFTEITNPVLQRAASATAAIVSKHKLHFSARTNSYSINARTVEENYELCGGEPDGSEPFLSKCSSVLIGEDLLLTAGHCVTSSTSCQNFYYVFGYYSNRSIPAHNVYECAEVITPPTSEGIRASNLDFTIIRLRRAVTGVTPISFHENINRVTRGADVALLSYPLGMPLRMADDASIGRVLRQGNATLFRSNVDAFEGSSGGAVVDVETGKLLGILQGGLSDFRYDRSQGCNRFQNYSQRSRDGEDVLSIRSIQRFIERFR